MPSTKTKREAALARLLVEGAQLWIVTYTHRHGADVWPRFMVNRPDLEEEAEHLDSWEGEEGGDFLDVSGPFDLFDPQWRSIT